MRKQRDLIEVIDAIVQVEPELKEPLRPSRESALFAAPEVMHLRWQWAGDVLGRWAEGHLAGIAKPSIERIDAIGPIWSGRTGPKPK